MNDKAWKEWAEADFYLSDCVKKLEDMGLSKIKIRDRLVEKALDVCPPKPKPLVISGKMIKEAIKQFIDKENANASSVRGEK